MALLVGVGEHEKSPSLKDTDSDTLDAVNAILQATESIERYVEKTNVLTNSIGPLADSLNQLAATTAELVALLAAMETARSGLSILSSSSEFIETDRRNPLEHGRIEY